MNVYVLNEAAFRMDVYVGTKAIFAAKTLKEAKGIMEAQVALRYHRDGMDLETKGDRRATLGYPDRSWSFIYTIDTTPLLN